MTNTCNLPFVTIHLGSFYKTLALQNIQYESFASIFSLLRLTVLAHFMLVNAGFIAQACHQNNIECSVDNYRIGLRYEADSSMGKKFAVLNRSGSSMGFSLCSDRLHSNEEENQEFSRKILLVSTLTGNRHNLTSCNILTCISRVRLYHGFDISYGVGFYKCIGYINFVLCTIIST